MAFNEPQKQAIRHHKGRHWYWPALVPGKTTVITNRICCLTEQYHADPGSILVITFTRAAAREMKERYEQMTEAGCGRVSFGTFHSVFLPS